MRQTAGYRYDVYLSYPHEEIHSMWVKEFFLDSFKLFLSNELGYAPSIFSGEGMTPEPITPGDVLREALSRSKILIPIWSVNYFMSSWCMTECLVMLNRQRRLSHSEFGNRPRLILPIKLFNGAAYPPFTQEFQMLDCRDLNLIYRHTPQSFELQKRVKGWTPTVAESINSAPEWSPECLVVDWQEDTLEAARSAPEFQLLRPDAFRLNF